jgi:hypothetical protein
MNMRGLWRLAIWGTSAALALMLVVVSSYTENGSRRLATAWASPGKDGQKAPVQLASRSPEAEAETRRLADTVRTLTADRDRLVARLGVLERNLEDMTGSIKRPPGAPVPSPSTPTQSTAPTPATAAPAPAREAALSPAGPPATEVSPPAVSEPAPLPSPAGDNPEAGKGEMGLDVGGATNSDGLRALWNSTKANHAALVEGLHPVVATRENNRTKSKELRLILGPVDSIETATRLCATLTAAHRYCQPVGFEGQKLAEASERKPAPRSATPPPAARLWPFR